MRLITRLGIFAGLAGGGFLLLQGLTEGDIFARRGERIAEATGPVARSRQDPDSIVIPQRDPAGNFGKEIRISFDGGPVVLRPTRKIRTADGRRRELPHYEVRAEDSRALRDGRHEFIDVDVVFYEGGEDDTPVREAARLKASRAFVELGLDEHGRRSVATDKDIELRDAVLETGENGRVRNLTIDIEHALLRATQTAIDLRTVQPDQPFSLRIADRGLLTLEGRGLVSRFPSKRPGELADGETLPAIEVEVRHDPVMVQSGGRGDARLTARGPLTYHENPATGIARIVAENEVRVRGLVGGATGDGRSPLVAFGDRLEATLHRQRTGGDHRMTADWRSVHLTGAPAGIEGDGSRLECAVLDLAPNLVGAPYLATAIGDPVLTVRQNGEEMRFAATDRIQVIELQDHWQPYLAGRGLPPSTFHRQLSQLMVFWGASSVSMPRPGGTLTLHAEDGLRVLGRLWSPAGTGDRDGPRADAMTTVGRGAVRVITSGDDALTVTGNRGFRVHADARGQTIVLGPDDPHPEHAFHLETTQLTASGTGACRMFQPLEEGALGEISLRSPNADLAFSMPGSSGALRQVAALDASFDQEGVVAFDATGTRCLLAWSDDEGDVEGAASRVRSVGRHSYLLTGSAGTPAVIDSERGGHLRGERILVTQLGRGSTALDARGSAQLVIDEAAEARGAFSAIRLDAERINVYPFLIPPSHLQAHLRLLPAVPERVALRPHAAGLAGQHLVARGAVTVTQLGTDGAPQGTACGDLLVLRQDGEYPLGRLTGSPAEAVRTDSAGQTITGRAPVILLQRTAQGELMSLLRSDDADPRIIVSDRQGNLSSFGSVDGTTVIDCQGSIIARPDGIEFEGPIQAVSLDAAGRPQPDGFRLSSRTMRMERDPATGQVTWVRAGGGADLRWRGLHAVSSNLDVDLAQRVCHIHDRAGRAWIHTPAGQAGWCSRALLDLDTYESSVWAALITGERTPR